MSDTPTSGLPSGRLEEQFGDKKPPLSAAAAQAEANRCIYCYDAPCIRACPTHIDIPTFIGRIGNGDPLAAAKTIFDSNILGMSCARVCPVEVLCEGACVYNHQDQPPIKIGLLQRHATDLAYERGETFYSRGAETGRRVALIGGGPASLACAHELAKLGHQAVIFEKRALLGGLNTTGVAPYKMRSEAALEEAAWVLSIGGIEVKTEVEIGAPGHPSFADLERDFDAVFVGFGLGPDGRLRGAGAEIEGVEGAVHWIERMKNTDGASLDGVRRAVVVGGGNTALDAAHELAKLGVPEVLMVYRGTQEKMSGYRHEWTWARTDGVRGVFQTQPTGFVGEEGLTGLRCVRLDEDKQPIEGSEHIIETDLCLLAIGQSKLGGLLADLEGIETQWGCVVVDDEGATGRPGWYAGGDCANGGKEVVNGAAEGKRAARGIDRYLANLAEQGGN